ncbi:MAG: hypothetical protein JZD41_02880, partial [Thermoproteus sp.]|nr:hypothetical protein [Thermoproteus sp.]
MSEKNEKIEIIDEGTHVQTTANESPQTQEIQEKEIQEKEKRKAKAMRNALLNTLDASIILLNTVRGCDDLYKILHEILYSVDEIIHKSVRMRPRKYPPPPKKEQPRKKWLFKTNEANEWARKMVEWLVDEL